MFFWYRSIRSECNNANICEFLSFLIANVKWLWLLCFLFSSFDRLYKRNWYVSNETFQNGHSGNVAVVVVVVADVNRTKVKPILNTNSLVHWLDVYRYIWKYTPGSVYSDRGTHVASHVQQTESRPHCAIIQSINMKRATTILLHRFDNLNIRITVEFDGETTLRSWRECIRNESTAHHWVRACLSPFTMYETNSPKNPNEPR